MAGAILFFLTMGIIPLQGKPVEPRSPLLCLEQRATGCVCIAGALRKRCMCALRGVHKCVCAWCSTHCLIPKCYFIGSLGPQRARKPFPASPPQAKIQCCDGCQGAGEPVTVMLRFRGKMVLGIFRPTQMLYLELGPHLQPKAE